LTNTATPMNTPTNTATPTPTVAAVITGTVTYLNSATTRPVSNVLLSGVGSVNVFATTDFPNGTYSLSGFGSGSYTVTPSKTDPANGLTSFDAAKIAQHVSGPPNPQLSANQLLIADVSNNGAVSSFDAGMIAKYTAGPPFAAPGIGLTGTWKFLPVSRNYASVTSSVGGENYSALLMGEVSGNWTNTAPREGHVGSPHVSRNTAGSDQTSGPLRNIEVALPSIESPADKEIMLPVKVENAAGKDVISYEFNLRYDPSVVQPMPDAVQLTDTVSRSLVAIANASQPGILRVVVYGAMPIDSDGVLLALRFTAVGAPGSVSPLAWERIMFNEGDSQVTTTDGQVVLF
jgi:hypothetical protein